MRASFRATGYIQNGMRALLVLNEYSRRGKRDGDTVCDALDAAGIECERDPGCGPVDTVIAAGGDGTILHAVPLALKRGVPLGIVPLGTFNDLARTLDVSTDIQEACATIAARHTKRIDLGRVNGSYFVNEASVGLSTRIARRQTPEVKRRFGVFGVISTTLQAIGETRPFLVDLLYDGKRERFRSVQLTVANSGHFGGLIDRDDAAIDDGWLDLYSVDVRTWLQAVAVIRKVLRRDAATSEGLRTRRAHRFEIRTHHAHHVTADGEPAGMTPAVFEVLPLALEVIVP